ncbi:MAG TPA: ATP-binding cassette domain-containing protein, partial [Thermoanaerobaculia bacterium]|nr:ATP-binding cassette domain-containing protein [Thermoanaerobaculia bacterium]
GRGFWILAATMAATAAAVPIAVGLAGEQLGPLLAEPARAFFLSTSAAVLAAALLPARSGDRRENEPPLDLTRPQTGALAARWSRVQRRALRDPGTSALVLFTAGSLAAALFGPALVPRPGDLSPDGGSFDIRLSLPDGATLAEAERQVRGVEEQLGKTEEVERFWSSSRAGRGFVHVDVRPRDRHPDRLAWLATRIRYRIPGAAAARIETGAGAAGGGAFVLDLEDRAKADEEGLSYRMVLRGGDLGPLTTAYRRILDRLDGLKVRPQSITGWGDPSVLLTLRPMAGTAPRDVAEIATALARTSLAPVPLPLPPGPHGASRSLVVVPAGAPPDPDRAVPLVADLLDRPLRIGARTLVPAASLLARQESTIPRVARQSGRFVVPIEVRFHQSAEEARLARRQEVDRNLALLQLPAGVDLERPALTLLFWQPDRLRLIALAVPLLLFAVAAWRLGGLLSALVALVPLAAGLLAATPLAAATLGQVDELTILALVASLCLALPPAAEVAEASSRGFGGFAGPGGGKGAAGSIVANVAPPAIAAGLYRGLRRETPWLAASLVPSALALAVPTLGVDLIRCRWVVPLRASSLCGAVALSVALVAVPPLRLAAARFRARDPEEIRRRRHPPEWSAAAATSAPRLAVRSLTKTYASGHKALAGVSFELTPGITGLLGPNGAGKTTLLRLLTGLLSPTRGSVSFRGVPVDADDLAEYRLRIGFLPQEFNAYPDFTAEQFLDHWALERGLDDSRERAAEVAKLLAEVGLAEHARRKVRDFSGGMRQRVGIARSLLGAPPILIVDEPTTGLDIESRGRFRQILLEQAADRIVLFSTHIASDIEAAASRILLLHRGRLRFDGTPEDLLAHARGRVFTALVSDAELPAFGHRYRVTARVRRLEGLEVRAVARPGDSVAGDLAEPNLEEAYLAEIERADAEEGREQRQETFSFL